MSGYQWPRLRPSTLASLQRDRQQCAGNVPVVLGVGAFRRAPQTMGDVMNEPQAMATGAVAEARVCAQACKGLASLPPFVPLLAARPCACICI